MSGDFCHSAFNLLGVNTHWALVLVGSGIGSAGTWFLGYYKDVQAVVPVVSGVPFCPTDRVRVLILHR